MKRTRELDRNNSNVPRDHWMDEEEENSGVIDLNSYDRRNDRVLVNGILHSIDVKLDSKQRALIFHNGLTSQIEHDIKVEWFVSPLFSEMNQLDWCFLDSLMKCYHAALYITHKMGGDKDFRGTFYHRNIMSYRHHITYDVDAVSAVSDTSNTNERTNLQSITVKDFFKKYFNKYVVFKGSENLRVDFKKINSMFELVDLLSPNWLHLNNTDATATISKMSASCIFSPVICIDTDNK